MKYIASLLLLLAIIVGYASAILGLMVLYYVAGHTGAFVALLALFGACMAYGHIPRLH